MRHLSYNGTSDIYAEYLNVFQTRFGLSPGLADMVAHHGEELCDAEHRAIGKAAYTTSLLTCVRNAMYQAQVAEDRLARFRQLDITPPVLDYGCGVGLLCRYLESQGLEPCYGHDLSGLQTLVAAAAGVKQWTQQPVATVICMNVLEHVEDPVGLLYKLRGIAPRVIANICTADKHVHIAPKEALAECRDLLKLNGGLY